MPVNLILCPDSCLFMGIGLHCFPYMTLKDTARIENNRILVLGVVERDCTGAHTFSEILLLFIIMFIINVM